MWRAGWSDIGWVSAAVGFGIFFFSSRRRHTRFKCDWSSDVCSSDLVGKQRPAQAHVLERQANDASAGAQIGRKYGAPDGVIEQHGGGATGDAKLREWTKTEDQAG